MRAASRNDSRRFSATLVVIGASVEYDRTSNVTDRADYDDDLFRAYLLIFDSPTIDRYRQVAAFISVATSKGGITRRPRICSGANPGLLQLSGVPKSHCMETLLCPS